MLWRATSKQQKMLPVLQHAQLTQANNSLKLNGRQILKFIFITSDYLLMCGCTRTQTQENRHKQPVHVCMYKNLWLRG